MPIGTKADFYSVIKAAIKRNEIAFGYIVSKDSQNPAKNYGVVLNPNKSDLIQFSENDRIILIAEE